MLPVEHARETDYQLIAAGIKLYDTYSVPAKPVNGEINLFDRLGFDVMVSNVPVVYAVEAMQMIVGEQNAYWWKRRADKGDIAINATGNIQKVDVIPDDNATPNARLATPWLVAP